MVSWVATRAAIYRSLRARHRKKMAKKLQESPGPTSQKNGKKDIFDGLQESPQKYPKKSKNIDFQTFLGLFRLFRVFWRPPKRPFLRLSCDFGPGGPGDSCKMAARVASLGSEILSVVLGIPNWRFYPETVHFWTRNVFVGRLLTFVMPNGPWCPNTIKTQHLGAL